VSSARIEILGLPGIGEIAPGTDLADTIARAAEALSGLRDDDVVVVSSKIVSKAEGQIVELSTVVPSEFARAWAADWNKDPAVVELVLREARRVVRQVGPILITETRHGFVCANSAVDQSNAGGPGLALLLPNDPDASARRIRKGLLDRGADTAVIVTDTFGRPWREGQTDVAIGLAGIQPIRSYVGERDPHGLEFHVQALCVVDELASAAELVKGNLARTPAAVVRGFAWERDDAASIRSILRGIDRDLFR
jgi:coenzyme F420-0:L-glutamate ligase / coenzyme F420-1:gamma-L-glutamate ligase